jgi:hypothetical protein
VAQGRFLSRLPSTDAERALLSVHEETASLGETLFKSIVTILALSLFDGGALAQGAPTRFWNLTQETISEFYLAPAGTANFGPNQCKNDKDGTVDPDERLRITGVAAGLYDAKLVDVKGRACTVRNVKIEAGQIFSIEEKELTSCNR